MEGQGGPDGFVSGLADMRRAKGITVDVVSGRTGIGAGRIAGIESGDVDPTLGELRRYALAVGAAYSFDVLDGRTG